MANIVVKVGASGEKAFPGATGISVPSADTEGTFETAYFGGGPLSKSVIDRSITSIESEDLAGITTIGQYAFYSCLSLTYAVIPEGVTMINGSAFSLSGIQYIVLPSTLTSIKGYAFSWTQPRTIICYATTPPTLIDTAFDGASTTNLNIYVPASSVAAYQAASGWSAFASKIRAIDD